MIYVRLFDCNYAMQRNFRGTELALRYAQTDEKDGQEFRATLTHGLGFAKGKGRAVVTADFYHRMPIYSRDRAFSRESDRRAGQSGD